MMGVQLLSQLVCEMNQISEADASRSLTKHRKIASSFRDSQLFEIFQLSSTLLRTGEGTDWSVTRNLSSLSSREQEQSGLQRLRPARSDDPAAQTRPQLSHLRLHRDLHGRVLGRPLHSPDPDRLETRLPRVRHAPALLRPLPQPALLSLPPRPLLPRPDRQVSLRSDHQFIQSENISV